MIRLLGRRKRGDLHDGARSMLGHIAYEVVPLKSLDAAIAALPQAAVVSVTCSPTKGIAATQDVARRLLDLGHQPIPHLAARMVEGPDHARALAGWCRDVGITEVLVVGGDAENPVHYADALSFMTDLLSGDHRLRAVGVTAYPDGHSLVERGVLHEALHDKQALLADAGVGGWASTQMCFDHRRILGWLEHERTAGLTMPVHIGMPGVVDRARLMTLGARLGVGQSLRYLAKNRASVTRLMMPGGYDPTDLVEHLGPHAAALGIAGIHSFTFNAVADTAAWHDALLARLT